METKNRNKVSGGDRVSGDPAVYGIPKSKSLVRVRIILYGANQMTQENRKRISDWMIAMRKRFLRDGAKWPKKVELTFCEYQLNRSDPCLK